MFSRSGYRAIPLGDFDRFQQSNTWLSGSQRGFFPLGRTEDPWDQVERGIGTPQGLSSRICHGVVTALAFLLTVITFPISGWFLLKTVPTYERVTVFRLGRIRAPKGPGLVLLLPFIDHWQRVDLRTRAFSIPPCKLTSQDGALVSIGADVQFRVCDPVLSVMMVKDLNIATRMTAQNVMTRTLLKKYLREIQTEKLKISNQLLLEINDITRSWGLEVDRVELILEAVLQAPPDTVVAGTSNRMNSFCGVQGLDSLQQLALHFFGKSLVAAADTSIKEPLSTEASNALREEAPSASSPRPSSRSFWADRIRLVGSGGEEIQAQVEHVEVKSETGPPCSTLVQETRKHFDPEDFLLTVEDYLSESLVNQIRACYQFNVLLPGGVQNTYFIDLSTGHGKTGHGLPDHPPDVVLEMAESDLGPLVWGDLNPLNAYVSGKLRAQGDLTKALKLELLFKAMGQNQMS
ncbi:stomatin-like protein 1 isoform X2 [Eublepharis macularius]|uniref:Stomatin-like protein 1 isoform X2 n=1 Tax=Eublepharis macularius TaxID=481883 RepID=A0AA97KN91_EUBMA|nr:stomatin-like protein 1 isoform X2 [Eublepharis macularius]